MPWPVLHTFLGTESFSLYKLVATGFRKNQLETRFSWILQLEDASPLGGSHSFHFRRVRNSDFVRIHSVAGWCQIPKEVSVVPSECKATWKALPVGCLMYSVLPFGDMVAVISEPAGQVRQHLLLLCRVWSKETQCWEGCLPWMCLTYGLKTTMHPTSPSYLLMQVTVVL